jgi:hypothetical protein
MLSSCDRSKGTMNENDAAEPIDWALTTWEGARREQQRRWANLSLRELIQALEEMQALAERLSLAADPQNAPARSGDR